MANKPYRVAKKTYSYVELQHMSDAELKSIKKLLRDNVTRNLRKLQKGGFNETPATLGLAKAVKSGIVPQMPHINAAPTAKAKKQATKISEKQRLMGEIFEYQNYQSSSTGTLAGMKKFEADTNERVGDAYRDSSIESKRKFWELYDEQRDMIENNGLDSKELQKLLANYFSARNGKRITKQRSEDWEAMVNAAYDKEFGAAEGEINTSPSPFRLNT